MKEIYLLRHGDTGFSGRYTGASDVVLSEKGRQEVARQAEFLASLRFSAVYCSPLQRCLQTRDILGIASATIDHRLKEIDFGEWEGKTFAEIAHSSPDLVEQWRTAENSFCFPHGESLQAFRTRIDDFATALHALPDGNILLIAHGGVIRHLLCRFLHLPYHNYLSFKPECARFALIELHSEGGVLTGLNRGVDNG